MVFLSTGDGSLRRPWSSMSYAETRGYPQSLMQIAEVRYLSAQRLTSTSPNYCASGWCWQRCDLRISVTCQLRSSRKAVHSSRYGQGHVTRARVPWVDVLTSELTSVSCGFEIVR